VFGLACYDLRSIPFGSPANLFLSGKAEIAVETRQVSHRMPPGSKIWLDVYPQPILAALNVKRVVSRDLSTQLEMTRGMLPRCRNSSPVLEFVAVEQTV